MSWTYPQSAAESILPSPGGCFLSASKSSAQTDCGGSVLTHVVCSIAPLPPQPSPQTSPTCGGKMAGWLILWRQQGGRGFNKGIAAVDTGCSSCLNNHFTFQILSEWDLNPQLMKVLTLICVCLCGYLADSFHSNSSPSCCSVSISVNSVGVGVASSSLRMWRSRSAAGDTRNIEIIFFIIIATEHTRKLAK